MESSAVPGYTTVRHPEHDVSWMVVSASHSSVVCVACLVEQMEEISLPLIQRRVTLSLLVGLLRDGSEVAAKFGDNMLLCRHILDIVTDQFFRDDQYFETAVEVCQLILECVQSEDLVWYTIDKFHFQLQNSGDLTSTAPYLLLLGQLLVVSPAYGFHLLDKHESLLLLTVRILTETQVENCQCSVVYILIQLFDDQLQSDMSDSIRSAVCRVLVSMLSDAETLDLRVNLLALLKKMLKQATGESIRLLMTLSPDNKSLVMGLKKMFITKQEVLQTASAQCVQGLVANFRDETIVRQILESDLAEFLFESLHTQNGPQLNCVYQCLQTLTTYDQFFTRCHAVYGVESILRSLGMVIDMKNFGLMEKGFCLLASVLHRQPSSIPLFVNVTSVRQCVQLVRQGLSQSHPAVFLQALTAAQELIRQEYIPWPSTCDVIQDMVKAASSQMSSLNSSRSSQMSSLSHAGHRQSAQDQTLTTFANFITASCGLCSEKLSSTTVKEADRVWTMVDDTVTILVSAAETHLLPYIVSVFGCPDIPPTLKNFLDCMNVLTMVSREKTDHMCVTMTNCGILVQAHIMKYSIDDPDLCEAMDTFLKNLYQHLLMKTVPLLTALPGWMLTGIVKLKLSSCDVSNLLTLVSEDEDVAWTTLVLIYFSYLHHCSCVEGSGLEAVLQCFLSRYRALSCLPPLVIRCLTFLAACSSGDISNVNDSPYGTGLSSLIEVVESCPTEVWYTHHPVLVCWVFSDDHLAQHLGHSLMEHWLPLIDLSPHTHTMVRDQADIGTQDSTDTPARSTYASTEMTDNTDIEILEELAHSQAFFTVLLSMLVAPAKVASTAMTITEHLIGKILESSASSLATVNVIVDTCNRLFHHLFLQETPPHDYQVSYLLKVMTRLMTDSEKDASVFNIKAVYHVVKYVGGLSIDEDISVIKVCFEYLLRYTEDTSVANCLCIGPILTQDKEFMLILEGSLTTSGRDVSARLIAWLADTASTGPKVPYQIHISHSYLLNSVTTGSDGIQPGVLNLLSASLVACPNTAGPVVFSRDRLLEDTPLFTGTEIRTLYFHLQQLVYQESKDMFTKALDCIQRLYEFANRVHDSLALHLASHPWNSLWFETLIHMACQHSVLVPNALSLIQMLIKYPPGQQVLGLSGETFLQAVLKSDVEREQIDVIKHILSQCRTEIQKKVKPDLLQQVQTHLRQIQQIVH